MDSQDITSITSHAERSRTRQHPIEGRVRHIRGKCMWRALVASRAGALVYHFTLKYNNSTDLHPFPEKAHLHSQKILDWSALLYSRVKHFRLSVRNFYRLSVQISFGFPSICSEYFRHEIRRLFGARDSNPTESRRRVREDIETPSGKQ